jgi:mono/diheme cytochrome c family protein
MLHCQKCHPGGEAGLGPALNDKPLPVFLMRFQVRKGLGAMPAFPESRISGDELDDLLKYVVAFRRHGTS